ncbi:hypothetical protein C21_00385 [Arenibacter sp. NBRC 103722]|uniref:hypothetical protein n=1 Tax=Arenibacter sp. NBRC 103722 TaxID=1113929 RepID=UPI000853C5D3|nr:hypothetical protein [Arenibacter sp. NBRC 103722]GBF18228.1 hypothetical protein C21_00385 [Arenibacter sp. NBRC 103722]
MNRYIKAMEIGLANEEKGISYINLVDQMQNELGYKFSYSAELTFMEWFNSNFTSDMVKMDYYNNTGKLRDYQSKRDGAKVNHNKSMNADIIRNILSVNHFLNGEASKQYLDYLELKESRIAAIQARKQSNFSIGIAIGAILISSVLGWYSIKIAPEPPYDVKVIEDKTRSKELEKENRELKEELFKAEIMVKVFEAKEEKTFD